MLLTLDLALVCATTIKLNKEACVAIMLAYDIGLHHASLDS